MRPVGFAKGFLELSENFRLQRPVTSQGPGRMAREAHLPPCGWSGNIFILEFWAWGQVFGFDLMVDFILFCYFILIFKTCLFYSVLFYVTCLQQGSLPTHPLTLPRASGSRLTSVQRGQSEAGFLLVQALVLTPSTASLPWEMQIHLYDQHGFLRLGVKMEPFGKLNKSKHRGEMFWKIHLNLPIRDSADS